MGFDVKRVIELVVDVGSFLEWKPEFGRNLVCGLARLDGHSIAVIANQPRHLAGSMDVAASIKIRRMLDACVAFRLPLVSFIDVPGVLPTPEQEHQRLLAHIYGLAVDRLRAHVPKISVFLRKAYGYALWGMSGADPEWYSFAWPSAQIAFMGPEPGVRVAWRRQWEAAPDPDAFLAQSRRGAARGGAAVGGRRARLHRRRHRSGGDAADPGARAADRARSARSARRAELSVERRRGHDDALGRRAAAPRRGSRSVPRVRRGAPARHGSIVAAPARRRPARRRHVPRDRRARPRSGPSDGAGATVRDGAVPGDGIVAGFGTVAGRAAACRRGSSGAGRDRRRGREEQGAARAGARLSGQAPDRLPRRRSGDAERARAPRRRRSARPLLGPPARGARSPSRVAREPAGGGRVRPVARRVAAAGGRRRPRRQAPRRAAGAVGGRRRGDRRRSRSAPTRKRWRSCCAS